MLLRLLKNRDLSLLITSYKILMTSIKNFSLN